MRATTVRFTPSALKAIEIEAQHLGLTTAEFIREASLARAAAAYVARDGRNSELLDRFYGLAHEVLESWRGEAEEGSHGSG